MRALRWKPFPSNLKQERAGCMRFPTAMGFVHALSRKLTATHLMSIGVIFSQPYTQSIYEENTSMDYGILGGGALGLAAAYRLTQAGHSVMIFEQEATAGGLASGFRVGDHWVEKIFHPPFKNHPHA